MLRSNDVVDLTDQDRDDVDAEAAATSLLKSLGAVKSRSKTFMRGAPFSAK